VMTASRMLRSCQCSHLKSYPDPATGQTASFDSLATADLYPNRPSMPTDGRLQGQRAIAAEDGTSPSISQVWID
jgi:hypothetical protein